MKISVLSVICASILLLTKMYPDTIKRRPAFSLTKIKQIVRQHFGIKSTSLKTLASERDQNARLTDGNGTRYVLKIANAGEERDVLDLQNQALLHIGTHAPTLPVPRLIPTVSGARMGEVDGKFAVRLFSWLDGKTYATVQPQTELLRYRLGQVLGQLSHTLTDFSHPRMRWRHQWDLWHSAETVTHHAPAITNSTQRTLVDHFHQQFVESTQPHLPSLRQSVIHGDANDHNVLATPADVTGIIDFGDMIYSCNVFEVAIAVAYAIMGQADVIGAACDVIGGYHATHPLTELEIELLYSLIAMRLCVSVSISAERKRHYPDDAYLTISEQPAWDALHKLRQISADKATARFRMACRQEDLLRRRRVGIGRNLSISYKKPLKIVRGEGQYLHAEDGRRYLDVVNNVCHVGHSHPHVVRALAEQAAILNTNTRYLHDTILDYADRLCATLPDPLSVCFLVCSGSEANELALRLARAHTGQRDVLVIDSAYHGNTSTLIDISPYKFNGRGGQGKPDWVHVLPMPDPYRDKKNASPLSPLPFSPSCFIGESILGCGGQIVLPDGYLQSVYKRVRQAGGVCIADEVQVGFGRAGTHFWAFETQNVVPDIVTMGKPIGNGHPLAAVVTTPEIAASFANGMEYFNTFGGNPVSCAVGMAVLDVIESEGLQENARIVGEQLLTGLRGLMAKHAIIGDVRGLGLFAGVELVNDHTTLAPAAEQASYIVERMKEYGILLSTDGPLHNVIKMKPPLCFSAENATELITTLDKILSEELAQPSLR